MCVSGVVQAEVPAEWKPGGVAMAMSPSEQSYVNGGTTDGGRREHQSRLRSMLIAEVSGWATYAHTQLTKIYQSRTKVDSTVYCLFGRPYTSHCDSFWQIHIFRFQTDCSLESMVVMVNKVIPYDMAVMWWQVSVSLRSNLLSLDLLCPCILCVYVCTCICAWTVHGEVFSW